MGGSITSRSSASGGATGSGAAGGGATSGATAFDDSLGGPGAHTPLDPSRWPVAAAGAAAHGCRARSGGAHAGGTPPAPPALGAAAASAAATRTPRPVGLLPRALPTPSSCACACADRRARCSRCSRAAGTARRPQAGRHARWAAPRQAGWQPSERALVPGVYSLFIHESFLLCRVGDA